MNIDVNIDVWIRELGPISSENVCSALTDDICTPAASQNSLHTSSPNQLCDSNASKSQTISNNVTRFKKPFSTLVESNNGFKSSKSRRPANAAEAISEGFKSRVEISREKMNEEAHFKHQELLLSREKFEFEKEKMKELEIKKLEIESKERIRMAEIASANRGHGHGLCE